MTSTSDFLDDILKSDSTEETSRDIAVASIRKQLLDDSLDDEGWRMIGLCDVDEDDFRSLLSEAIFFDDLVDAFTLFTENDMVVALITLTEWKVAVGLIRHRLGTVGYKEPVTTIKTTKKSQKKRPREPEDLYSRVSKRLKHAKKQLDQHQQSLLQTYTWGKEYNVKCSVVYNRLFRRVVESGEDDVMSFETFLVLAYFMGLLTEEHRYGRDRS